MSNMSFIFKCLVLISKNLYHTCTNIHSNNSNVYDIKLYMFLFNLSTMWVFLCKHCNYKDSFDESKLIIKFRFYKQS